MVKTGEGKSLTIKYAALQGNYWMAFGAVFSFVSVYLLSKGFAAGRIGMVMALGNVAGAVMQPWIASFADRSERLTLKDLMMVITAAGIVPAAALTTAPSSVWITAVLYMAVMLAVSVLQPLVNSVSGYYVSRGKTVNFGVARGAGSLAFGVMSWLMGYLVAGFGERAIPAAVCFLLLTLLAAVSSFRMERKTSDGKGNRAGGADTAGKPGQGGFCLVRKYRSFFLVLTGIVLLFAFHNMVNTYLIQIMGRFGGDSTDMGTSIAAAAVCEIPVMVMFSRIVKRIRPNWLLRIAGAGFLIKAAAISMAGSVLMVHASQLLQACSFALLIPASVYYSDEVMEEQDRVKGQAFITAAIALGGMTGNLLGGKMIDAAGVGAMLTAGVACAAAGMVFVWAGAAAPKKRRMDGTV